MTDRYDPQAIEQKWQSVWRERDAFHVPNPVGDGDGDTTKTYVLEMLPYPSGELHMGHVRNYMLGEVVAHYRRRHGFQVLRRIRADRRTQDLPAIIITASWVVEDILSGYSLRADGYVCKSVSFEKFVNALGHLGLEGLVADEPSPAKVRALRKAQQEASAEETSVQVELND